MELSELRVFLKVAAERSFSKAAMKLHRTQPAVSQAVRRLEDSVGERLFDRTTKDASLTDAGRLLRDYAERLLRLSEEAEHAVKDLRDLRRGRVLIGANSGVKDHVRIVDDVALGVRSGVMSDITEPGEYLGMPVQPLQEGMRVLKLSTKLPEIPKSTRPCFKNSTPAPLRGMAIMSWAAPG